MGGLRLTTPIFSRGLMVKPILPRTGEDVGHNERQDSQSKSHRAKKANVQEAEFGFERELLGPALDNS